MSHKPNAKLIGAFVTLSLLVAVGLILFFGSTSFFSPKSRFILFFDQSVNGLQVGSLVKFRGVPVGTVEHILIRANGQDPDSDAIPVIVSIDRSRIENKFGVSGNPFEASVIQKNIDKGLVGQLSVESYITGLIFVEFSFDPQVARSFKPHLLDANGIREIPTRGSSFDQITEEIAGLIADVGSVDLVQLDKNLNAVMVSVANVLEGLDSAAISASFVNAFDQFGEFMGSEDLKSVVHTTLEALDSVKKTSDSLSLEDGPLRTHIDHLSANMSTTLKGFDQLTEETSRLLADDSSLRYEFERTLRELAQTARSVQSLADYIERNPNALITGRAEAEE